MDPLKTLELESVLISRLQGKISLLQRKEEKAALAQKELSEILATGQAPELNSPQEQKSFIDAFLSYGVIESFLTNVDVEDIIVNALKPIYIHHGQKGFIETDKKFTSGRELEVFIQKLLLFSGRKSYDKIANLELANLGGRVNIVHSPFGPQLTITKAKVEPLSIIDLIRRGSLTYEVAAQLWVYVEGLSIRPANIVLAGGPGTGKTTLLNALFSFIPIEDRTVVIEDTLELNTFLYDSCSRLESEDGLTLADLVKNSLRMRPERIVIGEVRAEEARDMITAVNVGKYCMGTIHALTAREAILRLQNEPMNVPEILVNLIDVFVVLKRYHIDDKLFRMVDEVSETGGMEQKQILLSRIFKYNYDKKKLIAVSPSTVYRDRLSQESGRSAKDIITETYVRALILKTLADRNITTMKEVTTFCQAYRDDPQKAMATLGLNRKDVWEDYSKRV